MKQSCCELWNQELKGHQIERVQFYRCRARYPRLHGKMQSGVITVSAERLKWPN